MRTFDPKLAWELIQNERITTGLAVPAMLNFMLQVPEFEKYDFSSLRWILSGAAPVPVSLMETYAELGIEIHQIYGLTESCGPACVIDAENALAKIGSTGKAFFHTDVRLVKSDGSECAAGEPGEVLIRAPHVMLEYWNQPEATAETVVDGWLHTGDIGEINPEDGYLKITDRKKDIIVSSGGDNISPAKIENLLSNSEAIDQCMVYGDGKSYLVALIVPSKEFKDKKDKINEIINDINKKLTLVEKIKNFFLIEENFSIENGLLTPTMKVKRNKVTLKYKNILENFYQK